VTSLGERINDEVIRRFGSIEEGAIAIGLSRNFLYQITRIGNRPGAANPTLEVLQQIADALGEELGNLFPHTDVRLTDLRPLIDALKPAQRERRARIIAAVAYLVRAMLPDEAQPQRRGKVTT
jgi:transcriptional regulator with XRE-family HTH domain